MWRNDVTYVCTLIVTAITIANAMRECKISLVPSFLRKKQAEASTKEQAKKASSARSLLRDLLVRWAIVFYSIASIFWMAFGPSRNAAPVRGDLGLLGAYLFNVIWSSASQNGTTNSITHTSGRAGVLAKARKAGPA